MELEQPHIRQIHQQSMGLFLLSQAATNIEGKVGTMNTKFSNSPVSASLPPKKRLKMLEKKANHHERDTFTTVMSDSAFISETMPNLAGTVWDLQNARRNSLQLARAFRQAKAKTTPTAAPKKLPDQPGRHPDVCRPSSTLSSSTVVSIGSSVEAPVKEVKRLNANNHVHNQKSTSNSNASALSELCQNFLKDQQRRASQGTAENALKELRASCKQAIQQAGLSQKSTTADDEASLKSISSARSISSNGSRNSSKRSRSSYENGNGKNHHQFVIANNAIYYNVSHSPQNHFDAKSVLMELKAKSELALKQAGLGNRSNDSSTSCEAGTSICDSASIASYKSHSSSIQFSPKQQEVCVRPVWAMSTSQTRTAVVCSPQKWKSSLYQAYIQALKQ